MKERSCNGCNRIFHEEQMRKVYAGTKDEWLCPGCFSDIAVRHGWVRMIPPAEEEKRG